ncbi:MULTISPECIES: glycosyltransferase [unclassified Sphingopyxis]|jgi:GT2 family glycosyltransferase|uniref:glycosyltransferase n=1 Tax=unclassified Sphingopyxis TaxID=2614943 RepID=UPI0025EFDCC8|nr:MULTISPECIES: glycosyltransferase family 2 protein [unclassified Sphingopyxis]
MRIAVAIVNYRTPTMVLACLDSLGREREALPSLQAIVVDNASGDDSVAILSARLGEMPFSDWVQFRPLPLNGGFGWGNNEAILTLLASETPPDAILLINPDAMIEPGALVALVEDMARRPDAGAIGSQLVNPDGSLSGSAFRFPSIAREFMRGLGIGGVGRLLGIKPVLVPIGERGPVDWATGASVLIRTQALRDAGLFDTGFFLYFEEVELMHRFAGHGWKSYHCPESRVMHVAGAATGVVNGQLEGRRAPPDYIFQSRHRYFALTAGRFSAWLADVAWLTGDSCARLIGWLAPTRPSPDTQAERNALFRIGLGARARDTARAIARTSDAPGQPPAWMDG